ncbi:MAG: MATE family efflux transporter [Clostridia bacterium]|nr:MATE family efflux transporter [Clostridia bacterium]
MRIQLSDHFSYTRLIRFTLPSVIMMIFTSIYGVIDGIFVSNFVGKTPFAAINIIWPVLQGLGAVGLMIGTGGSALVSKILGEGDKKSANRVFSLLVYISLGLGVIISLLAFILMEPISIALGAEGEMIQHCVLYGRILIPALTTFLLQTEFQSFLVVAEKPNLGLAVTVAAGVTNIVFDALFIIVFDWGLAGAAAATALSQAVGGIIPLFYFIFSPSSILRLGKTKFNGKAILQSCTNGASEMTTNLSMSVVNILYNFRLLQTAGEDGVAAYGVIMYLNFIFISIFIGYSVGSAPIISFHFGAQDTGELKNLFKKSIRLLIFCSLAMTLIGILSAKPLSIIFVGYDSTLLSMTERGMMIYCISFLFAGINIFASSFFTALNNGAVSAALSFLRTLVFQILAILILPVIFGLDGIWSAIIAAEGLSLIVSLFFFIKMKRRYQY